MANEPLQLNRNSGVPSSRLRRHPGSKAGSWTLVLADINDVVNCPRTEIVCMFSKEFVKTLACLYMPACIGVRDLASKCEHPLQNEAERIHGL